MVKFQLRPPDSPIENKETAASRECRLFDKRTIFAPSQVTKAKIVAKLPPRSNVQDIAFKWINVYILQINRLEEKEEVRAMTEAELVHLRKEILLLGELQMKYKEKLQRIPSTMAEKQEALLVQAFEEQITAMEATVVAKSAELEATRAKMGDLEQNVAKKG